MTAAQQCNVIATAENQGHSIVKHSQTGGAGEKVSSKELATCTQLQCMPARTALNVRGKSSQV